MSNLLNKYRFELSNSLSRLCNNSEQENAVKEDMQFIRRYLNLLTARVEKEIEDAIKESEAEFNYDNPNWALKQAELLGYRRAFRKVKEIIRPIESNE